MDTPKKERKASDSFDNDALNSNQSPSKKAKVATSPQASPSKKNGPTGSAQAWTQQEDAAMMQAIHKLIDEYQPDYDDMLKAVNSVCNDRERTKIAVRRHWGNIIKPKLLKMTAGGEDEK